MQGVYHISESGLPGAVDSDYASPDTGHIVKRMRTYDSGVQFPVEKKPFVGTET